MHKDKIVTVEEALNYIKAEDNLIAGMAAAEPKTILKNLHTISHRVNKVKVFTCLSTSEEKYVTEPEYREKFFSEVLFYGGFLRNHYDKGNISYIPNHLHQVTDVKHTMEEPRVFVACASMPDEHGYMSLLSCSYEKELMQTCDRIILEINPNYPRIIGENPIHISQVTCVVKTNHPVPTLPDKEATQLDEQIADHIVPLIADGSCLQLGIGGTPKAVAERLETKNDLGIHTEMFTSIMAKLIKKGVVTGKRKNVDNGIHVASFIYGDNELYEYVNNNPAIMLRASSRTIDPYVMSKNDRQISINSSLSIDLTGQVCSESIGSFHFTGTGGQADTARGAVLSKGGKSFIAIPSTANVKDAKTGERKKVSRIVPQLAMGSAVSLQRNDVQYIVTEYGVVNLRGRNIQERCRLLISIAHPDFRDELEQTAKDLKLIF